MFRRFLILVLVLSAAIATGWLALRRADIPYDSLEAKYTSSDSKFLTLNTGEKVHYHDFGDKSAPVVLLVHGFASSLLTWSDWTGELSLDYRVISVDLPGHGLTRVNEETSLSVPGMVDFLDNFTQQLGVKSFYLVGSSMGGNTAWNFAIAQPERLNGLVLVSASGLPPEGKNKDAPFVFTLIRNPITGPLMVDLDITPLIRDGIEKSFYDQSLVTDDMVNRYAEFARAPGHRKALLALASREDPELSGHVEKLKTLNVPTLILVGDHDNLVPPADAKRFSQLIHGSTLIEYENVGHLPQEEIPVQSLKDTKAFLASLQTTN